MTYTLSRTKQLSVRLLVLITTMALVLSVGLLSPMLTRAEGAIVNWTGNAGDGSWHTAGNWDGGQIPSTGDTVIIPATSVVEYASGTTSVILQSAGDLTISGGTFNTTGESVISGKIVNNGVIAINGTSLTLSGGGEGSGKFQVYGGKLLKFAGGTYTIGGNVEDLGNCAYMIAEGSGTNVTFIGSYNVVNNTVKNNAKATWNGTSNSIGVLNASGQVVFNQKVTIKRLNLTGGTIDGSGDIAIDPTKDIFNPSTWTVGTMAGNGTLEVVSGAKLSIQGDSTKNLNRGVVNKGEISFLNTPPTILSTIAFKNEGLVRTDANCSSNVTISSYNQTTTGTLQIAIDSSAFTRLITNVPTLEGALHLFFKGTPTAGTSYDLISYNQKPEKQFTSVTSNLDDFDMQPLYGDNKLTVKVTNAGQTSTSATIDPTTATFDKAETQADVTTTITWNSATSVSAVKNGDVTLTANTDYTIEGNTLAIKKEYLAAQETGEMALTIYFDNGDTATLTIDIAIDECFIATAAFGSKSSWPVELLRHFRDQYLLSNAAGTAFVKFYYQNSPPIAAVISNNPTLKTMVRVLLAPFVVTVFLLYHPAILLLVMILAIVPIILRFMHRRYLLG